MEEYIIKKEYDSDEGETMNEFNEYKINYKNNDYLLRIEINKNDIYFIISLNNNIEYNYKLNMNLITITNKLKLHILKYPNLESILNLFDKLYNNNNLSLYFINDNYCVLSIKFINIEKEEEKYELKLYKHYTNKKDKFDILAYQIQLLKNNKNMNNNIYSDDKLDKMNKKIK